jgi:hypothetical protein
MKVVPGYMAIMNATFSQAAFQRGFKIESVWRLSFDRRVRQVKKKRPGRIGKGKKQFRAIAKDWDSEITLEHLRKGGFSDAVVDAVDAVTMRPGEPYADFVRRAALNPTGSRVKLADLEDNSDPSRIASPTDEDYERLIKYNRAIHVLCDN